MGEDVRVTVELDKGRMSCEAPTLEVARLVASAHGYDVDLEPMEPGRVKLTAVHRKKGTTISFSGSGENEVAFKMLEGFYLG